MSIVETDNATKFTDACKLGAWLVEHGVDVTGFGTGQAKNIQDLWQEVTDGETTMYIADSRVIRHVKVLHVLITNEVNKVLQEEYQVRPNGVVRSRQVPLSEKMKGDEDWKLAAVRAVKEELGTVLPLNQQVLVDSSSLVVSVEVSESHSYPGLLCKYTLHKVKATVPGLPQTERFMTTEQRPDGVLENHWLWTSEHPKI